MDVPHALGLARSSPRSRARRRSRRRWPGPPAQGRWPPARPRSRGPRNRGRSLPPSTKTSRRCGRPVQRRAHGAQQGRRDEKRPRPAVRQDVAVLLGRQQRVDRHRHDAGAEAAPEDDRPVQRVERDDRRPLLGPQPVPGQQARHTARALGELAIGQPPVALEEGGLLRPPLGQVAVDEPAGGVGVRAAPVAVPVRPPWRP